MRRSADLLPLAGIRVIEFSHMVMGPSAGMILADLGAEVFKIEPLGGDKTRRLQGSGAGYFPMYNRNKKSICIDLKSRRGREIALRLVTGADVLIENFRPGAMDALGFGWEAMHAANPRLIYCSLKGFLSGPYQNRTALDEVAQMMGGLAYMTGLPDRPMRAGASVIDVAGGMFGVIGVLAALERRHRGGGGELVTSSLFETTAFLVGQHMAQQAVTGEVALPMSIRSSAWAIYDIFKSREGEKVFVAVVSDSQWRRFCDEFEFAEFAADDSLAQNNARVRQRERILPVVERTFAAMSGNEMLRRLDRSGVAFAPVNKPSDLFDDVHLNAAGGLVPVSLSDGSAVGDTHPAVGEAVGDTVGGAVGDTHPAVGDTHPTNGAVGAAVGDTHLPALPIEWSGDRFGIRHDVPTPGEHCREILAAAGVTREETAELERLGLVHLPSSENLQDSA